MFFNYKNCTFSLSGVDILATNVNMSIDTKNSPVYNENFKKNSYSYVAEDTVDTTFSISYYLTGKDFVKEYLLGSNSEQGISGNFGGFYFNSGFITSYSIDGSPDSLAKADLEIKVFEPIKGSFEATAPSNKNEITPLNFSNFYLSGSANGTNFDSNTYNFLSFRYQYQREVSKYIKEENVIFNESGRAYFGKRSQQLSFFIENYDMSLPASGIPCSFYLSLFTGVNPLDTLAFSGILSSKKISLDAQGYAKSEFSLSQDFSHFKPAITSFSPAAIRPGASVTILGQNFINVKNVYFGNEKAPSFSVSSSSQIIATSPSSINSRSLITIETEETSSSSIVSFIPSVSKSSILLRQPT